MTLRKAKLMRMRKESWRKTNSLLFLAGCREGDETCIFLLSEKALVRRLGFQMRAVMTKTHETSNSSRIVAQKSEFESSSLTRAGRHTIHFR